MQTELDLVPVAQAAKLLGISRQSLDGRLRLRGIVPHRIVRAGRVQVLLDQAQIRAATQPIRPDQASSLTDQLTDQLIEPEAALIAPESQPARPEADLIRPELEAARAQIAQERAELLAERQALEQRVMRAEAMLAAAERIERSTAARCDKLEAKLEQEASQTAALRLELGEQRGLAQSLQLMLTGGAAAAQMHRRQVWWKRLLGSS